MAEYQRTANGLEVIGGTNVYVEQMPQAQYDDMSQAQQDDNHFRVITHSEDGEPGLQASEISTDGNSNVQDDLNKCLPRTIASYTVPNATMTYGQALNNLYALISNIANVPTNSRLIIGDDILPLTFKTNSMLVFSIVTYNASRSLISDIRLQRPSCQYYRATQAVSGALTDNTQTSNAAGNGTVIKIVAN